ncbi:cilia- and flagella-associated protein 99 [Bombyx mori]|uniref:Cilia- and flagella-associated protein 99-like n=1 Tax=Bombyx mori TaxID=7091 RepID=A0A8R2ANX8_BOMMO|nr:girdin [Bombyx mori]
MVYYYTVNNIKLLKNLIDDFGTINEMTPHEFMEAYIESFPESGDDEKLKWITETFLGVQRHNKFLQAISNNFFSQLCEEDQLYFMILFYAITFEMEPSNTNSFYKCLFNLSKPLLHIFTKFLNGDEGLNEVSEIAHQYYDTKFVTKNIIKPLFDWQPYIKEMGCNYAEHMYKIENKKHKPPTVPLNLNVLNRKAKSTVASDLNDNVLPPLTPPNSVQNKIRKMVTKSAIDKKLKLIHIRNQEKATLLLNEVKKKNYNYLKTKSKQPRSTINEELPKNILSPIPQHKHPVQQNLSVPIVRENAITIKRLHKRVNDIEQKEMQWLENILQSCGNAAKIAELEEFDRRERERERLLEIEKRHLQGQISHEDAAIAKTILKQENRNKYEQFKKEKEIWTKELEKWKTNQIENNRKLIEKLSVIELRLLEARNNLMAKKKEAAENIKKETEIMVANAMKLKTEELERKTTMIKEIKLLSEIAKKARSPKIIDLTETSGIGLLCEMSMAELQERLNVMKIGLKDELEQKKKHISEENIAVKKDLEESKIKIKDFMNDQAHMRKQNKKTISNTDKIPTKEINDLKTILEEKRKLRLKLTS